MVFAKADANYATLRQNVCFVFLRENTLMSCLVITSQCRNTGVAIRPPEALPITEMSTFRREYGLPHQ